MYINVASRMLSDGSYIWNVNIGGLTFHACSEKDAYRFADKLCGAINEHTVDNVSVEAA